MKLRALAQGRDCQVRLVGICNGNPETTVLAHFRLIGISGLGFKPGANDLLACWSCSACHAVIDTDKSPQVQLDFAKAVFRTQATLIAEKEVTW